MVRGILVAGVVVLRVVLGGLVVVDLVGLVGLDSGFRVLLVGLVVLVGNIVGDGVVGPSVMSIFVFETTGITPSCPFFLQENGLPKIKVKLPFF